MIAPHPFIGRVAAYIRKERLIGPEYSLLVGVSGGPDSVALLRALVALREPLGIHRISLLHFNHRLRGEASDADQAFVASLAERMGLECLTGTGDVRRVAAEAGVSLEMAGRMCRHRFFQEALADGRGDCVALAHTANDQAEEVLLRLFRGTGPSGMAAMLPKTDRRIIRPLLFAWRKEILEYLAASGHAFREDASNAEPSCRRNALRLEVFPLIEHHFHGRVMEAVARHAELVRDEESWWDAQIEAHWASVCFDETPGDRVVFDCEGLEPLHPAMQRRLLREGIERLQGHLQRLQAVHVEALRSLIARPPGTARLDLPGRLQGARRGGALILSTGGPEPDVEAVGPSFEATFSSPGEYATSCGEWTLRVAEAGEQDSGGSTELESSGWGFEAWMDADYIVWPLRVRGWLPGDRFVPLGLGGSKKLQDFFVDAKVERARRRRVPLLCDGEKICWVVGMRLDERVKVTPLTRRTLVVRWRSRNAIPDCRAPGGPVR